MVIEIEPKLEAALAAQAKQRGISPEAAAVAVLRERLLPAKIEPRDQWERELLAIATDCGVALSNEALSSEGLYD